MTKCGRRHTSDQRKTHTLGTVAHCSDTVYNCSTTALSLSTVGHSSILSRPPLLSAPARMLRALTTGMFQRGTNFTCHYISVLIN
jgi:hypothetical protein